VTNFAEFAAELREHGFGVTHAVRLTDSGRSKIMVIKIVRELTGLGLKDAKDAVDALAQIVHGVDLQTAQHAAAKLREAGAAVELGIGELRLYAFDPTDPRRGDQPIERIRVVERGLAFEHGRLGNWTPAAIVPCELDQLPAAVAERRRAWTRAGKHETGSELSILDRLSARDPTLEDRLRTTAGDARLREAAVYGDWLQTQGDPRGLIAAAALAVDEAGDIPAVRDERLRELERLDVIHASHTFGPAQELMEVARWQWCGPVLDSLVLRHVDREGHFQRPATCDRLAELLVSPICACLRSLALVGRLERDAILAEVLAAAPCAPGLRELHISSGMDLTLRGDAFPRLEMLTLRGRITLGPARLGALRKLDVALAVPQAPLVAAFVELDTPALEDFAILVQAYDYWDQNYGPLQSNLFELLSQPGFARLRSLTIAGGPFYVGFADLLARIPAIATIEHLDLRNASMNRDCQLELERSRGRLPGLLLPQPT
jgi:hypothetical protein